MTMNIGPMFVFLRMYLIAVCLDVRRSGECGGAASPRPARVVPDPPCSRLSGRVQLCTITFFLVWKILYAMRMRLWT